MAVVINDVTKFYQKTPVVNNVSFQVEKGDRLAVLGANGAGKSTLLEMIATVIKSDDGEITYNGLSLQGNINEVRKGIGYVPQELALFSKLTIKDHLDFWSEMSPVPVAKSKIAQLVELVGLSKVLDQKIEHLSGGMKRKVNIILSLLHEPELIILDEPTVGIDIQSKLEINRFVKAVCLEGKTLFFSSHDLQEIQQLADKIVYLHQGKLNFYGTMEEAVKLAKEKSSVQSEEWKSFCFLFSHF